MPAAAQRRRAVVVAVLVTLASMLVNPRAALAAGDVLFVGAGWGHAVGLTQYGALGLAREGKNAGDIISHYYTGGSVTRLADLTSGHDLVDPAALPVRVGIMQNVTLLEFEAIGGRLDLCQADDGEGDCPPGRSERPMPGERWTFAARPEGGCQFYRDGEPRGNSGSCSASIRWGANAYDITPGEGETVPGPATRVILHDVPPTWASGPDPQFEAGILRMRASTKTPGTFHVAIDLTLDDYVLGIAEMPSSWPAAALQAQAIAARSYGAYKVLIHGPINSLDSNRPSCGCHLYADTRDQVYVGAARPDAAPAWVAAVTATGGLVVSHPEAPFNKVVPAFYSSSSGGATEDNSDVWGGTQLPYLVTRPDPWSLDRSLNPNAAWTKRIEPGAVAAAVGLSFLSGVAVVERNSSGSASMVTFTGLDGDGAVRQITTTAGWTVSAFGLKSRFYDVSYSAPLPGSKPPPSPMAIGLQDPRTGIWHLRHGNNAVESFYYGDPLDIPFTGDWNGDGITTLGLYRVSAGFLFLRDTNTQGPADIDIYYGDPGDLPIAGDWDGNGTDTVGIFRPSNATFYLRNSNTQGIADVVVEFGERGDVPIAGDWDGDGVDTVGVYRASTQMLYLTNSSAVPVTHFAWEYAGARPGDEIVVGDWDGDGVDTVGVFRPATSTFYLRDTYEQTSANISFVMGESWMNPVAGFWGE